MPFKIIRNDLTQMATDAIVNTANPMPVYGRGTDFAVYQAAGEKKLLAARKKIGNLKTGQARVTPGFDLKAKWIIHTVGPVWKGGMFGEEQLLADCYKNSLRLARRRRCRSVAFPLISTGSYGFPKDKALKIALNCFEEFLQKYDMEIYLVVFGPKAVMLSEKLTASIDSYIDDRYVQERTEIEYGGNWARRRGVDEYETGWPSSEEIPSSDDESTAFGGPGISSFGESPFGGARETSLFGSPFEAVPGEPFESGEQVQWGAPLEEKIEPEARDSEAYGAYEGQQEKESFEEGTLYDELEKESDSDGFDLFATMQDFSTPPEESERKAQRIQSYESVYRPDYPRSGYPSSGYPSNGYTNRMPGAMYPDAVPNESAEPQTAKFPFFAKKKRSLDEIMEMEEETFQQMLMRLIKEKGMKNADVYKRAGLDKRLFAKIKANEAYVPKKNTALLLAISLRLSLDETLDLIGRAGYTLSPCSKQDLVVRFFIENGSYNLYELELVLFNRGLDSLQNFG